MASISCGVEGMGIDRASEAILFGCRRKRKKAAIFGGLSLRPALQRGLDLESPRLEQWLGDVLGILVTACPLAQTQGTLILIGLELELLHRLLKGGHNRNHLANRLGLPPVRISATRCHDWVSSYLFG